jgi:quercetin dioxygenase-like cupin family protein
MQRWGFLRGAAAGGLVATGVTGTDRISPGGRRPGANITGLRSVIINLSLILAVFVTSTSQPTLADNPGRCEVPVAQRTQERGCYLDVTQAISSMPPGPVYWHLYSYPTRATAETARGPNGTVVEALGKIWLYTIAEQGWKPSGGERVAVIGPLPVVPGRSYTARYMEAVFTPGMSAPVHTHSGPEAWYLISGAQCLETPSGITVRHAGEGAVVEEGPAMALSSVGNEIRRSVVLVLHDSSRPWVTITHDWQPKGLCPK